MGPRSACFEISIERAPDQAYRQLWVTGSCSEATAPIYSYLQRYAAFRNASSASMPPPYHLVTRPVLIDSKSAQCICCGRSRRARRTLLDIRRSSSADGSGGGEVCT